MSFNQYEIGPYQFRADVGYITKILPEGVMRMGLQSLNLKFAQETIIKGYPKFTVYYVTPYDVQKVLRLMPELSDLLSQKNTEKNHERCKWIWPHPKLDDRLFEYQVQGVRWLLQNKGGYLADEMGLGKTIQALQFLENTPYKTALIVVPASVSFNWEYECREWAKSWNPYLLGSKSNIRKVLSQEDQSEGKIAYVVTWSQLANCGELICTMEPDVIICDEAHRAKSLYAKRTMYAKLVSKSCDSVVLLSGTPMRNCAIDLFTQMNMISPNIFSDFQTFSKRYSPPTERTSHYGTYQVYDRSINMDELREKCKPFMFFRKKKDVLKSLPPIRHRKLRLPMANTIRTSWDYLLEDMKNGEVNAADLIRHRQEVGALKARACIDWIDENSSLENPLVVFLVHKNVRKILSKLLSKYEIIYDCIVGDTPKKKRQEIIERFQSGEIQVLICSEAAKEGITLTRASQLLQLERFWVPADEEQAEARVHRIGTKNPVIVTHAYADGTIDDLIISKLAKKRSAIQKLFEQDVMEDGLLQLVLEMVSL